MLSDPLTAKPLFPNLRYLYCEYTMTATLLFRLPLPSLISLDINFKSPQSFRDFLESFPELSSISRRLTLHMDHSDIAFSSFFSRSVYRWQNLETLICPETTLDVDALVHLSRMSALSQLTFRLSATSQVSDSPLCFSDLNESAVFSKDLHSISRLLSRSQLPAITDFSAVVDSCPLREELSSYLDSVRTSNADHTIENFTLDQSSPLPSNDVRSEALLLGLEDLRPCMTFRNLRRLELSVEWNVELTDSDLLVLASAWPHLEDLIINVNWGWNTSGGITPKGVLRLLQTCRSLRGFALAIDTQDCTESPPSELLAGLGSTLPPILFVDVLDSIIEVDSVPAIIAFFTAIASHSKFAFSAWEGDGMVTPPSWETYKDRWYDIYRCVIDVV